MCVDELSVIARHSCALLCTCQVGAHAFERQRNDWVTNPFRSKEICTKANDRPEILYMEAAGDSCSEFFFHSRLISSMSRKSFRVKIGMYWAFGTLARIFSAPPSSRSTRTMTPTTRHPALSAPSTALTTEP